MEDLPWRNELVGGSPVPIVSMVVFNDRLYVATAEGVFVKGEDDRFRRLDLVSLEGEK